MRIAHLIQNRHNNPEHREAVWRLSLIRKSHRVARKWFTEHPESCRPLSFCRPAVSLRGLTVAPAPRLTSSSHSPHRELSPGGLAEASRGGLRNWPPKSTNTCLSLPCSSLPTLSKIFPEFKGLTCYRNNPLELTCRGVTGEGERQKKITEIISDSGSDRLAKPLTLTLLVV